MNTSKKTMESVYRHVFQNQKIDAIEKSKFALRKCYANAILLSKQFGDDLDNDNCFKRMITYADDSRMIKKSMPSESLAIHQINDIINNECKGIQKNYNDFEKWKCVCYCFLMMGDFPTSYYIASEMNKISDQKKDLLFVYVSGILHSHFQQFEKSLNYLSLLVDKEFSQIDDVYFRLGIIYRYLGKYEQSIKTFTKVNPQKIKLKVEDLWMQMALSYQLNDDYFHAENYYIKIFHNFPIVEVARQLSMFYFLCENNLIKTKGSVDNFIKIFKKDPVLVIISALVELKLNNLILAYELYSSCTEYFSESPYFWFGFGVIYFCNNQLNDSIIAFQKVLYLKNDIPEAWLNLGLLFEIENKDESAYQIYEVGLEKCSPKYSDDFSKRINAILSQEKTRKYTLSQIDYSCFLDPTTEKFAKEYLSAIPKIPFSPDQPCENKNNIFFSQLSTLPSSIFS